MAKSGPEQNTVVLLEPFRKLVKLVARAFYDDYTTQSDNRGIAVVVLDALASRQWVREEDLAKVLQLHAKQLRKIIRLFEEQKLIMREHRKETAKDVKRYSAAVAATSDGRAEAKVKLHTHSYCCLDYAQIYDVVRYKLDRMKKKLKDELEYKNTVQEYSCPNCERKYNALDAPRLISKVDDSFRCEKCNGELVVECNKLTSEDVVDGDGNGRKGQKLEVQLKPLMDQLNIVKDLPVPEFGTFLQWEARAAMAAQANDDLNTNDPLRSQGGYGSTPIQYPGETMVVVNLVDGNEDVKPEGGDSSLKKPMPEWMIREGMNLTAEQRGEMRKESQVDGGSGGASELSDNKKSVTGNGDENDLNDAYVKACLAEWLKQQELAARLNQQESDGESNLDTQLMASTSSERQVGKKSKREEEEEDDDVEWEEETPVPANNGNYYKADEEEEEDVDWEEG